MLRIPLILLFVVVSNPGYSNSDLKKLREFEPPEHSIKTFQIQALYFSSQKNMPKTTILLKENYSYDELAGYANFYTVSGWLVAGMGAAVLLGQLLFKDLVDDESTFLNTGPPLIMIGVGTILIVVGSNR